MSVWNPENVRDVAEAVGVNNLPKDVQDNLSRDVEFRLGQLLEEALKFMRHAKRTTLTTQDVSQALRVLDVEPLYGYESTRPLRFGEASMGPGQPLWYVEDEEVDFEKLINAPLPKVPRDVSFTAHWLAVDGVQPSIPQNPTSASNPSQDLLPKGPGANTNLAALNGFDNVTVKPLVKHIVSKELQLYFDRICSAVLDETNDEYRNAAYASLRTDPGLHQLVAYFVNFVQEKVTHSAKNLFILTQMMHLTTALIQNPSLYVDPYIASIVPPVLTCLVGKQLGTKETNRRTKPPAHFELRRLAASLLEHICRRYAHSSQTLKPRVARTLLKHFLDPTKPFGTHYGTLVGMLGVIGPDGCSVAVLPNIKSYDTVLKEGLADESKKVDAEMVVLAIVNVLEQVQRHQGLVMSRITNGDSTNGVSGLKDELAEHVGEVIGSRLARMNRPDLEKLVLSIRPQSV